MSLHLLMAYWAVSISLIMAPGADWAYAIAAGMRQRALVPAVAGMLCGYLVITVVMAAGAGALVTDIPTVMSIFTVIGSSYLMWVGVKTFIQASDMGQHSKYAANTRLGWGVRGFFISGVNPDALVLFLILLPQFTNRESSWSLSLQISAMGAIQMVNCAIVYFAVGLCARKILATRPLLSRCVSKVSGVAMVFIAAMLVADQFI